MHVRISLAALGLLFTAMMGCGDPQNTTKTTSGTSTGGTTESGGAGGMGGSAGMGGTSAGGMGGSAGMGGGCAGTYEDCTTPADDNCDGDAPTCSGDGLWAKVFGDAIWGDTAWVATDNQGNVFVATNLLGQTIDFGGGILTAQGQDVTLALLNPDGAHLWSKRYGDAGQQILRSVRGDGGGGIVLGGSFTSSIDFGGGAITAPQFETHPFVARIDGNGNQVFARGFSGSKSYETHAVAGRSDGSVVVGGCGQNAVDLGVGAPPAAVWSAFVASLSPTGQTIWAKTFTSSGTYVCVDGIAIDKAGNVAATGVFEGTVEFGNGPVTSAGSYDAFVMGFDATGKTVFHRAAGAMAAQAGTKVDFDPAGDIVVAGTYQNSIDWGPGPHTTSASTSTFLTKFDAMGNTKWSKAFGGATYAYPGGFLIDPAGYLLLTGGYFGTVDFGDGAVTSKGTNDLFVVKLDAMGQLIWKKSAGDGDIQEGQSVAVDGAGHVFVGGRILSTIDMGTGPVTSMGKDDALVAKLKP